MRILAILLLASISAFAADTVFVMRHAERAAGGMGNNVGITEAGKARAEAIARLLADAGIKAVFTSEVARTQQTAAPLAAKLGITPQVVPADDVPALIAKLKSTQGNVMVVGHSNTVPAIVKQLTGTSVPDIPDTEFDRLYILNSNSVTLLRTPSR